MKNTNTSVATPTANLPVCAVCKQAGKQGALWNFFIGDSQVPTRVHRPCGEILVKQTPKANQDGTKVHTALVPSPRLREQWRQERLERQARQIWNTAFANAKPIVKPATKVAVSEPAPVLAA